MHSSRCRWFWIINKHYFWWEHLVLLWRIISAETKGNKCSMIHGTKLPTGFRFPLDDISTCFFLLYLLSFNSFRSSCVLFPFFHFCIKSSAKIIWEGPSLVGLGGSLTGVPFWQWRHSWGTAFSWRTTWPYLCRPYKVFLRQCSSYGVIIPSPELFWVVSFHFSRIKRRSPNFMACFWTNVNPSCCVAIFATYSGGV